MPALIRFVPSLAVTAGGKLSRHAITSRHRREPRRRPRDRPQAGGRRLSRLRPGAQGERGADAAIARHERAGALNFVPFDLSRGRRDPGTGARSEAEHRAVLRPGQQCRHRHGGPALQHATFRDRGADPAEHAVADRADQICRARHDDGGRGRIVNISSIIASTGYSGLSVYGATKASMLGFTRSWRARSGALGITVNAVAPGFMDTEMTARPGEAQREQDRRRSALRRLAEVEDVAAMVAFLMGETRPQHHRHGDDGRRGTRLSRPTRPRLRVLRRSVTHGASSLAARKAPLLTGRTSLQLQRRPHRWPARR